MRAHAGAPHTLTHHPVTAQVPPRTLMAVAHLQLAEGEALDLDSDLQDFVARALFAFPLFAPFRSFCAD